MTTLPSPTPTRVDHSEPRPLPLWASIPIILLSLTAAGWIIHWYVGTHPQADEAHLLGDVPTRSVPVAQPSDRAGGRTFGNFFGGGANRGGLRDIRQTNTQAGRESFQAQTERAKANFYTRPGKPMLVEMSYGPAGGYSFLPDDVRRTIAAARQLAGDSGAVVALKLTADQVRQLRQRTVPTLTAAAADRTTLLADLAAYRAAAANNSAAAKAKLLADLDAVADRSHEATLQTYADRVKQINAAVTPQQWTQFRTMGGPAR